MKKLILFVLLMVSVSYAGGRDRSTHYQTHQSRVYDSNYRLKYRVKDNKVYDTNYRLKYRIRGDKVYDSNYRLQYRIKKGN